MAHDPSWVKESIISFDYSIILYGTFLSILIKIFFP